MDVNGDGRRFVIRRFNMTTWKWENLYPDLISVKEAWRRIEEIKKTIPKSLHDHVQIRLVPENERLFD